MTRAASVLAGSVASVVAGVAWLVAHRHSPASAPPTPAGSGTAVRRASTAVGDPSPTELRGLNPEGRYYAARALRDLRKADPSDEAAIARLSGRPRWPELSMETVSSLSMASVATPPKEGDVGDEFPWACEWRDSKPYSDKPRVRVEGMAEWTDQSYGAAELDADEVAGRPLYVPPSRAVWVLVENCSDRPIEVRALRDVRAYGYDTASGKQLGFAPGMLQLGPFTTRKVRMVLTGEGKHGLVVDYESGVESPVTTNMFTVRLPDAKRDHAMAACVACNGEWGRHGIHGSETCYCRAHDAGRACRDGLACEGECLLTGTEVTRPESSSNGPSGERVHDPGAGYLTGRCSEFIFKFGCMDANSATTPWLLSVWGSGSDDVWAVESTGDAAHWNGTTWVVSVAEAVLGLNGVWGSASGDVWAVGAGGMMTEWNGAAWTMGVTGATALTDLYAVWSDGNESAWTAGTAGSGTWNGTSWTLSPLDSWVTLYGLWGSGPNDVWGVGVTGNIAHWTGTGLTSYGGTASSATSYNDLHGVWGSASDDVWSVGANGTIVNWNGTAWSASSSGTTQDLQGVWGSGASDVWAVGFSGTILHWNGTGWSASSSGTTENLLSVWGEGPSMAVWVVGEAGTILEWNGSAWIPSTSGTSMDLESVWGSGPSDIWSVGLSGTIVHFNGTAWSASTSGTSYDLYGVSGSGPNNVWVVGAGASTILSHS